MIVPTNDKEVKSRLRELGLPICFFGEQPQDRRERLSKAITNYILKYSELPAFKPLPKQIDAIANKDIENEHFIYNGT